MSAQLPVCSDPASTKPQDSVVDPMVELHLALLKSIPFVHHLGAQLLQFENGHAKLHLVLQANHTNNWGGAHGGVVMSLLDSVMGLAARSAVGWPFSTKQEIVTVQMNTQFMRSAYGSITARGAVTHHSLSMFFCDASIHDENDCLCATACATFKAMSGMLRSQGEHAIAPAR